MSASSKRALVLSGGGAKGVFEAGILSACRLIGLRFDVITGSSIGALNAVLFAEYIRRCREEPESAAGYFDHFLSIWESLDAANLVDFDLLEPLVKDLARVEIGLDDLLHIWWGFTGDSVRDKVEAVWHVFWAMAELDDVLDLSLRNYRELYESWRDEDRRAEVRRKLREALRRFLAKHRAERGLFEPAGLRQALTSAYDGSGRPPLRPDQRLSSFRAAGVDVRLTRANVRSGKLEISAHHTLPEVLAHMVHSPGKPVDRIIGDPQAVDAALASAAFPAAFVPRTLAEIYPTACAENDALHAILAGPVEAAAFGVTPPQRALLSSSYPRDEDLYIDGGTLDNHPLSAAITAIRDAAYRAPSARQAAQLLRQSHDVFVVFLGPRPEISPLSDDEAQQMMAHEYALRAWNLMQNARLLGDVQAADRVTELLESASGWKAGQRPDRLPINVIRIYPEEMFTATLSFHRRMGFNRERNRQLLAMGCATMIEELARPANQVRLEASCQEALAVVYQEDPGAPRGWRCGRRDCRVADACPRA